MVKAFSANEIISTEIRNPGVARFIARSELAATSTLAGVSLHSILAVYMGSGRLPEETKGFDLAGAIVSDQLYVCIYIQYVHHSS